MEDVVKNLESKKESIENNKNESNKLTKKDFEAVIKIKNLSKLFNDFKALSNVNINISDGVFGLLGPNGAGKTTLINILVGKLRPTSGSVNIMGYDVQKNSIEVRKNLGYLPEDIGFYDDMTALNFLKYLSRLKGLNRYEASREAFKILELMELEERGNQKIKKYSSGMKQRLGIGQAIIGNPQILLLDEPTGELDPVSRKKILRLIDNYAENGRTVIVSTHILPEIKLIADRFGIIKKGKIVRKTKMKEVDDLEEFYEKSIRSG